MFIYIYIYVCEYKYEVPGSLAASLISKSVNRTATPANGESLVTKQWTTDHRQFTGKLITFRKLTTLRQFSKKVTSTERERPGELGTLLDQQVGQPRCDVCARW